MSNLERKKLSHIQDPYWLVFYECGLAMRFWRIHLLLMNKGYFCNDSLEYFKFISIVDYSNGFFNNKLFKVNIAMNNSSNTLGNPWMGFVIFVGHFFFIIEHLYLFRYLMCKKRQFGSKLNIENFFNLFSQLVLLEW